MYLIQNPDTVSVAFFKNQHGDNVNWHTVGGGRPVVWLADYDAAVVRDWQEAKTNTGTEEAPVWVAVGNRVQLAEHPTEAGMINVELLAPASEDPDADDVLTTLTGSRTV